MLETELHYLETMTLKLYFEMETLCAYKTLLITCQNARCQNQYNDKMEVLRIFLTRFIAIRQAEREEEIAFKPAQNI
jgi:hypothetical protein